MMFEKGISHSYLICLADKLLLYVKMFSMTDETPRKITIQEIMDAADEWSKNYKGHSVKQQKLPKTVAKFINIAFMWLSHIGMLDDLYTDDSVILNRLFTRREFKVCYLTAPLLKERCVYLEKWERMGAAIETLREIAFYQLHSLDVLHLENGKIITENELITAADTWSKQYKQQNAERSRKLFLMYIRKWLISMELYEEPENTFPLKDHVMEYLHWLSHDKGYSPKTIKKRYSNLKVMMNYINPQSMDTITPQMLDSFLQKCRIENGHCRRTISGDCSVYRDFFRYGQMRGWNSSLPVLSLRAPRIYKDEDIPSYVPWDVVQKILKERENGNGTMVRDYALLLLLSVYGMRCSEVTGLKLKDIDWRNERFFLRRAKGCKPQIMPLIPVVGDAIIRYIKEVRFNEGGCEYIFTRRRAPHGRLSANTMYTIISKILKKHDIQIRHYGPHSLRHGRATQLINAKHSLKDIADILGHMSLDTTAVYAKVNITTLREVADINWEGIL